MFSPANQLTHEIKEMASSIYEIPYHCFFPRWYTNGSAIWLESSSGSNLMTVNFHSGKVVLPGWLVVEDGVEKTWDVPKLWKRMHSGSLFNADGSAVNLIDFDWASSLNGWKESIS